MKSKHKSLSCRRRRCAKTKSLKTPIAQKPEVAPRSCSHVCLIKLIFTYVPYLHTHNKCCCPLRKWTNSQIDRHGQAICTIRVPSDPPLGSPIPNPPYPISSIPISIPSTHHNSSVMISVYVKRRFRDP